MTVCIAAACERGTKAVVATDRVLSYAGIVSDNLPGKMIWIDNWLVLYAGTPSNTSMIPKLCTQFDLSGCAVSFGCHDLF
jgi:hypothetical protein